MIQVPHGFEARPYQKKLYNCLPSGKKRGISVWHRRAGKDKTFMAILARESMLRVGAFFYMLPYYKQVRKIIWDGMDSRGIPYLGVFPPEIIAHKNNQEMILSLKNGSKAYFLGSDNIDSIVGTNPIGILFSEFSLHKPAAWDFLRPILMENNGFALFNGTPRGKNHMYKMLKAAEANPDEWFSEVLTIHDTGIVTDEMVEAEIANGMVSALAKQEFYCSFDAALTGAYYDEPMTIAPVHEFNWDRNALVHVAWDLGISDTMILVFVQKIGQEIHFIDCIASAGHGLEWYVKQLKEKPYVYGYHYLPHDVKARELNNGKSRLRTLYELGLDNLIVNPKASVEDGINATRIMLHKAHFHATKCKQLVEALKTYRANYDEEKEIYTTPVHDWSSHFADAVRAFAVGMRESIDKSKLPESTFTHEEARQSFVKPDIPKMPHWSERYAVANQSWNPLDYDYAAD